MAIRRILIVDHDISIAQDLEARLAGFGYDVAAVATAGHEALALAEQTHPHLALMDLALEGDVDGIATADELRQRWRIPVIYTTADASDATLRRARIGDPSGYLEKPFSDRDLRLTIELALCKSDRTRQVHELEDRFFSVSIDMLCFLDFSGYFKRLNPAWERTLGFTREELMSRPFIEFVHPDDRERTLNQNRQVRAGGQALGFENRYLCKDGSYRWFLWNAAPDAPEQVIYSVARDITARKQAEEEREQLVRELQAALAEVRTLQQILPICSYCRRVRDDENYWRTVEGYLAERTTTRFSHSICPTCYASEVAPLLDALESE